MNLKSIHRRLLEMELDKLFPTLNGDLVLDMGGRDERYSDFFKNSDYYSIDIKPSIKDGRLIQGDGHCLPFPDNTFDIIISTEVIEHTKWPWIIFAELCRVLKPGGKLLISWPWLFAFTHNDYWRIHLQGMIWLAEKHNMEIEYSAPVGGMLTNICMQLMGLFLGKVKRPEFFIKFVDKILFKIALNDKKYNTKKHASDYVAIMRKK